MDGISRLAGTFPGLAPDRAAQREEAQVQDQEEAPRQRPDTVTLRGKALSDQTAPMGMAEARTLLDRIAAEPEALLHAHDTFSPASVARLLELDAA